MISFPYQKLYRIIGLLYEEESQSTEPTDEMDVKCSSKHYYLAEAVIKNPHPSGMCLGNSLSVLECSSKFIVCSGQCILLLFLEQAWNVMSDSASRGQAILVWGSVTRSPCNERFPSHVQLEPLN